MCGGYLWSICRINKIVDKKLMVKRRVEGNDDDEEFSSKRVPQKQDRSDRDQSDRKKQDRSDRDQSDRKKQDRSDRDQSDRKQDI